jgi:octaprenyl-diphosphate synthase
MDIKDILQPIHSELGTFEDHFRLAMRSKVAFVDIIARYIIKQKGKRIRPALVLLSAKACGEVNDSTHRGASLVEILHTATLIHDDVVDEANTRRGFPSINAVWKNKIAVLMGDYLLAKGLLLSLDNDDFQFLKTISESVRQMSEAEILQIKKSKDLDIDEATYFRIISGKTASLFATCCDIGATSVTGNSEIRRQMNKYGEVLGLIFQMRDDLLDFTGRRSITGKPTGLDMKEKKLTLPLIHSLANAPSGLRKEIIRTIKNGAHRKDIAKVIDFAREYGGIDYTIKKATEYSQQAQEVLEPLPHSPAKESLLHFIDFVLERKK